MASTRGSKPTGSSSGKRNRTENRSARPPEATRVPGSPARSSTSVLPVAAAVLVVLLMIGGGYYYLTSRTGSTWSLTGSAGSTSLLGDVQPNEGQQHVAEGSAITYKNVPPSSGPHYPAPKPWGSYDEVILPGYWVHNLEHGGVALLYNCPSGCPEVVAVGRDAVKTFPVDKYGEIKIVTTPDPRLPDGVQVAAVAWQYVKLYHGDFSRDNFLAFYNAHVDRSPEDVP